MPRSIVGRCPQVVEVPVFRLAVLLKCTALHVQRTSKNLRVSCKARSLAIPLHGLWRLDALAGTSHSRAFEIDQQSMNRWRRHKRRWANTSVVVPA